LANEVTRAQLEQTLGSLDYVAAKWGVALTELETARESEENDTAQEEDDEDPFAIDTSKIATETPVTAPSAAGLEEALKNIDDLVGLGPVKRLVHQFVAVQRAQLVRKGAGLKVLTPSPHLVFKGNPGTGKTTVARHVGRLYHELGLLSRGHLVEVDRSGLVGGYVGQTALKTKEVLDSAKGGVLFIDEAYALNRPHANDYGHEVMETVLTYMENNRGDLVVVVAGYPAEMDDFLKMNPGIASRFDYTLDFPDFSDDELVQIFVEMAAEHDYTLDELAVDALKVVLSSWGREEGFGNARDIRRLFHGVVAAHSEWVVESGLNSGAELSRIQSVHVPLGEALAALGEMEQNKNLGPGYL
jgi:SpoVK/Ycf46/Vps4 family AAA+-type ATPase